MYQRGLSYGIEVGFQTRKTTKDSISAVDFFQYYKLLAGWGRFEISKLESEDGAAVVKIYDNFFAQSAKSGAGNPSCYFLSGLMAGIAEGLFEEGYHCLERQCLASGAEFCEFVVRRNPS